MWNAPACSTCANGTGCGTGARRPLALGVRTHASSPAGTATATTAAPTSAPRTAAFAQREKSCGMCAQCSRARAWHSAHVATSATTPSTQTRHRSSMSTPPSPESVALDVESGHAVRQPRVKRMKRESDRNRDGPSTLPRLRWRIAVPLLVGLAIAIHALLPRLASLSETGHVLQRLRWWAVALAVTLQIASYVGNGYTVRAVASLTHDRLSLWAATRLVLAANSVGLLAGGLVGYAALTYHWTRDRGISHEGAILCGWLPALMNDVVLVALTIAGVIELLLHHLLPKAQLLALALLLVPMAGLVIAAAWAAGDEERLSSLVRHLRRMTARLRRRSADEKADADVVDRIVSARKLLLKGGWRRPLLGAVANAGFEVLGLWWLFVAARQPLGLGTLLAGYGLPDLLSRIAFFLPGGLGVIEGGMIGLYAALGVPTAT